jgi:RHS repeat-associated protein
VADIMEVASRWRMKDTDPGWDAWYDLDGDGDIDIVDIMLTVVRWGESCESADYTYDAMGNRLSMTTPTEAITYTYDLADRLLNISDGTTFTWDGNGNQLSKGSTNYTYDTANRLTQVANGATTVQFTYDGDGKRTSKTVNGTSTSYLYDVNAVLPVVLVETTDGADTLYTYGTDLIAMTEPGGVQSYYHHDGLGSVRNLSDGTGAAIASYTYEAFGNLRMMKGSSGNAFQFTGEQNDDETGLIYLRARYYAPNLGRFIGKDPLPGFDTSSQTLNRYVYAYNNPATYSDPSGQLVPMTAAIIGVPIMVGGLIAFLANPEVANAPTHNTLFLYKREPFKPVLHAVESVVLSKLFGPLKPGITKSGLQGALAGLQKYSFGLLLGRMLDDFIYGDTRVLNPYYNPPGTMRPISPPSSGK